MPVLIAGECAHHTLDRPQIIRMTQIKILICETGFIPNHYKLKFVGQMSEQNVDVYARCIEYWNSVVLIAR